MKKTYIIVNTNFKNRLYFNNNTKISLDDLRTATIFTDKRIAEDLTKEQWAGCHNYEVVCYQDELKNYPGSIKPIVIYGSHE